MTVVNGMLREENFPKRVIIKQAENGGLVAEKTGGDRDFDDKPIVAEKDNVDELFAKCKKWLAKG